MAASFVTFAPVAVKRYLVDLLPVRRPLDAAFSMIAPCIGLPRLPNQVLGSTAYKNCIGVAFVGCIIVSAVWLCA